MMDWTDRHCRVFHRTLTRHALLYTEMVTAAAIRHGDRQRLLGFSPSEQPVALQIGGSDPRLLADAAKRGEDFGYCEINLNVGCPSDRVQEGRFGACLMAEPGLVAECVAAMAAAVTIPVTVKCRLGIDEQDEEEGLHRFVDTVRQAPCRSFIVHARKAWLKGLSPKENREVPPLNHPRVHRLKQAFPDLRIILNGGLRSIEDCPPHLDVLDGVMLGRAAYEQPWFLASVDPLVAGAAAPVDSREAAVRAMLPYIADELARGTFLSRITRHMLGLFHGEPGGRLWRRVLSEEAHRPGAGLDTVARALDIVATQRQKLSAAA